MRRVLARFALVLSLAFAGWALGEAIASRLAAAAASRASALPAGSAAAGSRTAAFADSGPSGRKSEGARRTAKRPATETSSNAGDFLRANAPVVIPAGVSEIGYEPAGEAAAAENRSAPSRPDREAPAPGAPAAQEAPAIVGTAPASPLGTAASAEDEAITVEVRRKLEGAAPGRRIQVSTRQGVVTLSGAVDTEQEKSEAIEAARKTPGVSRVEDRLVVLVS